MSRFSKGFLVAFAAYVAYLCELLEIREWRITLANDPPDNLDAAAEIKCTYGRKVASIKLCREFFSLAPDEQRHVIIHELIHVLTDGLDNVIENGVDTLIGKPAFTVLHEAWNVQLEYLTDHLAYVVEDLIAGGKIGEPLWRAVLAAENVKH